MKDYPEKQSSHSDTMGVIFPYFGFFEKELLYTVFFLNFFYSHFFFFPLEKIILIKNVEKLLNFLIFTDQHHVTTHF
jgi:hypothetical protein